MNAQSSKLLRTNYWALASQVIHIFREGRKWVPLYQFSSCSPSNLWNNPEAETPQGPD